MLSIKPKSLKFVLFVAYLFCQVPGKSQSLKGEEFEYAKQMGSRTAKQTWWFFEKRLNDNISYRYHHVYIEFLNVFVKNIEKSPSGKFKGLVDLDLPHDPAYDESNQEITFDLAEIDDWFMVNNNYLIGGFWVRIMPFNDQKIVLKKGNCRLPIQAVNEDFVATSALTQENDDIWLTKSVGDLIFTGGNKALKDSFDVKIKYPDYAQMMGIEGSVVLQFSLNKYTGISNIKVIQGVGGGLNDAARNWLFQLSPCFKNPENGEGFSTYTRFRMSIEFKFTNY